MHRPPNVGFDGPCELVLAAEVQAPFGQARNNIVHQDLYARTMLRAFQFALHRGLDSTAPFMTQDHKERSVQMRTGLLNASHYLRRNHGPRHTHDEQLSKICVENQFGGHPRVGATEDSCVRALTLG